MKKKRRYIRVNTEDMTPVEFREYERRLAYTRKYTRSRNEWQKALRKGLIDPKVTLEEFRREKTPFHKSKAIIERKKYEFDFLDATQSEQIILKLKELEEARLRHEQLQMEAYELMGRKRSLPPRRIPIRGKVA